MILHNERRLIKDLNRKESINFHLEEVLEKIGMLYESKQRKSFIA